MNENALKRAYENPEAIEQGGTAQKRLEELVFARTAELEEANRRLQVEDIRLQALLELSQAVGEMDERTLIQQGLEFAVLITGSEIGYLHFINTDQETIELVTWTAEALKSCEAVFETHYPISKAGVWADSLRTRKPVIHNNYQALETKKGYPPGHSHIVRHIGIPVIEDGKVQVLVGVGNKPSDYADADVRELQLISNDLWRLVTRRRAERALRESEQVYRTLFESSVDAIAILEAESGRFLDANRAAIRMYGVASREELLKLTPGDISPEFQPSGRRSSDIVREFNQKAVREGSTAFEWLHCRADGTVFPAWVSLSKLPGGKPGRILGVVRDISDIKRFQRELEAARDAAESASRAKSTFLANMSHEIRTPLNAIVGFTHLLRTNPLADHPDTLRKISEAAQHLTAILNDILDLSRIEAGKIVLSKRDFTIRSLVSRVVDQISERAREKGLDVVQEFEGGVDLPLRGDDVRLSQILLNIASNAVKFTEKGHVHIRAQGAGANAENVLVRFEIQDTGIGIPRAEQTRLFQSFEQADDSPTRKYGGTGLGLPISKHLVELMRGKIELESEENRGSTFRVTLELEKGTLPARGSGRTAEIENMRILVIEDHDMVRNLFEKILKLMGMRVACVGSGEAGLELLEKAAREGDPFRVSLIDGHLPDITGIETARRIQGLGLPCRPKCIMVTGFDEQMTKQEMEEAGISAWLMKPITSAALSETLREVLSREKNAFIAAGEAEECPSYNGRRALVAEDDEFNQSVAAELLRSAGLAVDIARNGKEAVEMVRGHCYDLILMDVQMPVMDGIEAAREIRALPACASIPILAFTAGAFPNDRERCLAAGMNGHVAKPVIPALLYETISRWIPATVPGGAFGAVTPKARA